MAIARLHPIFPAESARTRRSTGCWLFAGVATDSEDATYGEDKGPSREGFFGGGSRNLCGAPSPPFLSCCCLPVGPDFPDGRGHLNKILLPSENHKRTLSKARVASSTHLN